MPRARIYLRNSSDKQARAATIDAQRPDCHKLAARVAPGWEVVEYADEGVSGDAPLAERVKLHRLLAEVEPGDIAISFAQDRMSRSDDMIEHAAVFGVYQRVGVIVHTVQEGALDMRDQIGRLRALLQADGAAAEKRRILARTTAGKHTAAEKGRKPQGATPYGLRYSKDLKTWSLDEKRAPIVRDVFARLTTGETCSVIAKAFTAAGHPVARTKSGVWTARMVWQLATRRTYMGEWQWSGKTIPVPAIVDAVTWRAAQARMLEYNRRGLKRTRHCYLLDDGTGHCDVCARPLQIRWGGQGSQIPYYICASKACALRWRRTVDADAEVWRRMVEALQQPDLIERALTGATEAAADASRAEEEAAGYELKLERLPAVRSSILAQYRKGHITEDEMERELATIARERALLDQSAAAARESASRARVDVVTAKSLRDAVRTLAAEMERSTPEQRREELRMLRPTIRVADDEIKIHFRLRMPVPVPGGVATPIALVHRSC